MIEKTSNWIDPKFDTIIDVRAPSEFADDHIVGSINCPVLTNNEREEVGFLYKNVSGFKARVLGASMTARNIAGHIERQFYQFGGDWRPLIYCWRGGQRSRAMSLVLQEVGWRVAILDGGHKKYREDVIRMIPALAKSLRIVLISGQTGSAKTRLLNEISLLGGQVLDLERLANHRGSLIGAFPGNPQPSQKFFESLVVDKLMQYSKNKLVFVESESSKVGQLHIPAGLWSAMSEARCVELKISARSRAKFLIRDYHDLREDKNRLRQFFSQVKPRVSSKVFRDWLCFLERESWDELALSIIENYYDPAYLVHRSRKKREKVAHSYNGELTGSAIKRLAQEVMEMAEGSF